MAGHGCESDMLMERKKRSEEILLPSGRVRAVTTDILQRVTGIHMGIHMELYIHMYKYLVFLIYFISEVILNFQKII